MNSTDDALAGEPAAGEPTNFVELPREVPGRGANAVTGVMLDRFETQMGDGANLAARAAALDGSYAELVRVMTSAESAVDALGDLMFAKGQEMTTWQPADLDQWRATTDELRADFDALSALCRIEYAR